MRIALASLAFVLLAFGAAHAQSFEPGWVLLATGDTLHGEIDNNNWEEMPTEISFRPAATAPAQTYRPADLRLVHLAGGRRFVSARLPFDRRAETRLHMMPARLVIEQVPEQLLAELLIDGPAQLLRAQLPGAVHYFIRRPDQEYIELTERRYYVLNNQGFRAPVDGNNYRAQLEMYFGDCPPALAALAKASFTASALSAVVQAYNAQCSPARQAGTDYVLRARPTRMYLLNVGVLGGGRYNMWLGWAGGSNTPAAPVLQSINPDNRLHLLGGLYADVLQPGRHLAIHGEVTLAPFGRSGEVAPRPGQAAFRYEWSGLMSTYRVGFRWLNTTAPHVFVGLGLGTSIHHTRKAAIYDAAGASIGFSPYYDEIPPYPYAELGLRVARLTFNVSTTVLRKQGASDALGGYYNGRILPISGTMGFCLNRATNQRAKRR